jgi:iron complex outermembrane receptor protein
VDDAEGLSYLPAIPRQEINHRKLSWVNTLYLRKGARAALSLGLQQNDRREFEDVLQPESPALHFRLRTFNYDLHYLFAQQAGWQLSAGLNGMLQHNENQGIKFLIPDYLLFDAGGYIIAKKHIGRWSLAGGLRADHRRISSDALMVDSAGARVTEPAAGGYLRFAEFARGFSSPSGSIGASYSMDKKISLKLNIASGYRAPNIAELSANGVHEGAIRYEYGSTALRPENSFQVDAGIDYASEHLSVNGAIFYNYINNFISIRKLSGSDGADSIPLLNNEDGYPAFIYSQGGAGLFGGELYADLHPHPLDWLHIEHTISYVQGRNAGGRDSARYLPNMPAARWLAGLRAQSNQLGSRIGGAYFKIELDHYFARNRIYSAYGTEAASAAYTLLNASLGFDILRKRQTMVSIIIAAQNLGDIGYQNHLSRLRYAGLNAATGRTGIFGQGRNVSLQFTVPLSFL